MSPRSHNSNLPSSKIFESALLKDGFLPKKCKRGSHLPYEKEVPGQITRIVVVPLNRKEIPMGTLSSMLRQAGWSREYFERLVD